jgi:lysophospholipase L1-like esterase
MKSRNVRVLAIVAAIAIQVCVSSAQVNAPKQDNWVPTWATAQQLIRTPPPAFTPAPAQPARAATPGLAATSTSAQRGRGPAGAVFRVTSLSNQSVRMVVRTSIGGRRARVKLSHAFGSTPVIVGAAHLARRATGSSIVPGTDRALTVSGKASFTMMPGVVVESDPVDIDVPALGDLAISVYLPSDTGAPTTHATALHTTYISSEGDFTGQSEFPLVGTTQQYYWVSSVEVAAPADGAAIVAFGDSITDGARSTPDTNNSWPALLAARLGADKSTANIAVINEGIGGNRLFTDAAGLAGVNALARLDRDVFSHPGVKWLMILEGINDVGTLGAANPPNEPVTKEDLIWVLQQVIDRAHAHGIKVIGCTLTPYEGAGYARENGEAIRMAVNEWIRTSGAFDALVDFEAATRDPNNPKRFKPEFDPGDHLHPNDTGYKAMADAVNLSIFTAKK